MTWATSVLSKLVTRVDASGPDLKTAEFTYVDLGAVDSSTKTIMQTRTLSPDQAPSRARQRVSTGDVLVSTVRPNLNGVAQVQKANDGAIASTGFCVLRPLPDKLNDRFLFHWTTSPDFVGHMTRLATGASYPAVSDAIVKASAIPLPPLPEQRRIAAILDQADELLTKRRRALTLLDELAESLFMDMFGAAHAQGDPEILRLDAVIDAVDRINYGVVQPGEGVDEGVPLIRVGDMRLGGIRDGGLKSISLQIEKDYVRSRIRGTEILVSCVGSVGEVSTVGVQHIGFNVARAVARVPIEDPVQRAYVAAALRSSPIQAYFKKETRTVSQPTLNIKQLAATPILWPRRSVMSLFQRRISALRAAQEASRKQMANLEELYASLQHRGFRGDL